MSGIITYSTNINLVPNDKLKSIDGKFFLLLFYYFVLIYKSSATYNC